MENKIKAGIVGGTGYTGGELIRLLLNHPYAELAFALSRNAAGKKIYSIHQDLMGETEMEFSSELQSAEYFSCVCHIKRVSLGWRRMKSLRKQRLLIWGMISV